MRIFVTGATGFIGSALVQELLTHGHQVLGLTRSEKGERALREGGAEPHHGNLEDLDSLRRGAEAADGVAHLAFIHDFSKFQENMEKDSRAVSAMAEVLAGSNKPFVVTFGTAMIKPGTVVTEDDAAPGDGSFTRNSTEGIVLAAAGCGVRASILRLPPSTHGAGDYGFVPMLINKAREKGLAAYVGDGSNRWPAAHRLDAATLYRLALEQAEPGTRLHAIAEEGIPMRAIAEAIGQGAGLPVRGLSREEAAEHFGWMAHFVGLDAPASSRLTRERFGWQPRGVGLLEDMEQNGYFRTA